MQVSSLKRWSILVCCYLNDASLLQWMITGSWSIYRLSVVSRKPKLSQQPIRGLENTFKNQRELEVKPSKLPKVRENADDQVVIGFSFASDWLREWCEFFGTNHRAEWGKSKAIPDYSRHSIKNRPVLKSTQPKTRCSTEKMTRKHLVNPHFRLLDEYQKMFILI